MLYRVFYYIRHGIKWNGILIYVLPLFRLVEDEEEVFIKQQANTVELRDLVSRIAFHELPCRCLLTVAKKLLRHVGNVSRAAFKAKAISGMVSIAVDVEFDVREKARTCVDIALCLELRTADK